MIIEHGLLPTSRLILLNRGVVCGVCLNHCYYGNTGSSFNMYVWEDFKNAGGDRKSAMYGSGWRKFYADKKLGKGQLVYFFLDQPSRRATICYIQYGNGSEDEEITEVDDEESIEEDDEGSEEDDDEDDDDGEVPHNIHEVIVRTRGLELTAIEETELQSLVPLNNSFVGLPFVHRFTRTDVLAGMMATKLKIAKNFKEIQSKDFDVLLEDNTNQKKQGSRSSFKVLSIQCAQRDPQNYQMCKTPKSAVPDEEIVDLMYKIITFLAHVEGIAIKAAINSDKTIATYGQLGNSMKREGRVESYVLNVYCRHLFNSNHPRNSRKHYFFHTASEYFLGKWKNNEARIWWRDKLITSFAGASKAHDLNLICCSYQWQISSFICVWYESHMNAMNFNTFTAVTDCGIFTLKLMGWCPSNPIPIAFSAKDIPNARIRYAVDLMFSPYNKLYDEKKRVKEHYL
ncbi:hypothetical protein ZWY2020_008509 [Hordeum vulgare]|nr:hypothetical protein ZWY2020_008509 [Hordeum vulgare]